MGRDAVTVSETDFFVFRNDFHGTLNTQAFVSIRPTLAETFIVQKRKCV